MALCTGHTRWTVFFSGRVQGVGFRYTTVQVARSHPVSGYVRNLPDGRVECVMEGTPEALSALLLAVENEMRGCIRGVARQESPATGEFTGFSIRH